MNADALITSLGNEAAREEVLSELDRLLAAHAAGTLPEDEHCKLEARAVEEPEFRRTLDAYTPLGPDVEQRIVGALRVVLGREPSASSQRSSAHDSDVMRASNGVPHELLRQHVARTRPPLQDSAVASWSSAGSDGEYGAGLSSAALSSAVLSSAAASPAAVSSAAASPAAVSSAAVSAEGSVAFRAVRSGVAARVPDGAAAGGEQDPYTDRRDCDPALGGTFPADGDAAFEQLMQQSYAEGQLAWPTIKVSYEAFSQHVRRAVGKAPDWEWHRHAGDLYLCCACALGDRDATRLLDTQILPRAAKAIARIESDASFVDEALQVLRHKLFVGPYAKISVYSGRGSLTAWLRVTATRVALDGLRALGAQRAQQVDLQDRMAQPSVNPLSDLVKSRYAEAFQEALRIALRQLSPRDRNLLRLRLVGHCGIDQLGQMYRVHRATAARWLKAAHARVFDSVREQLRARFQLSDEEFDQMALDMQSRLELSLSGLGDEGDAPPVELQGDAGSGELEQPPSALGEADRAPEPEHSRHIARHEDDEQAETGVSYRRD